MDSGSAGNGVLALDAIAARAGDTPAAELDRRRLAARIDDLSTISVHVGDDGHAGIRFSHRNVVFKRFARALALPEIE